MKITKEIYDQLIKCPKVPPETGGILGSKDNGVISVVAFDSGIRSENGGTYIPKTDLLNATIADWEKNGIKFRGLFHTHMIRWPTLSRADCAYIKDILNVMPAPVKSLYFPLVFPGKYVKVYLARKTRYSIDIIDGDIDIL